MPLCHKKRGLREETYSIKEKPISTDPTSLPYSALPLNMFAFNNASFQGVKESLLEH
jgi:hypothetical protein